MTNREFKILFRENKAYLAEGHPMSFAQLGIPATVKTFKEPAYWIIRILRHSVHDQQLFCEIKSYHIGAISFDEHQNELSEVLGKVRSISFKSIDTAGLLRTAAGNTVEKRRLQNYVPAEWSYTEPEERPLPANKKIISETFYVPLKNVRFKLGGVCFEKKFRQYENSVEITIPNYDIREEFDAVKNYFANILKTKKIQVAAQIEITDNAVTSIEASSPEIARIDKQLIDNVKFEFVQKTTRKKVNIEVDKSLFTMEEYFHAYADEKFRSNAFYEDEKELFEDILSISNTRHYKHLRYLSSQHAYDIMKLRFVHQPFSFIFLIRGERHFHIVWETLDTEEATYVWHIAKDINVLKMTLRKIEDIINVIKVQGKTAYINTTEDPFRRIYHDYSDLVDGFVKWKGELENYLT